MAHRTEDEQEFVGLAVKNACVRGKSGSEATTMRTKNFVSLASFMHRLTVFVKSLFEADSLASQ